MATLHTTVIIIRKDPTRIIEVEDEVAVAEVVVAVVVEATVVEVVTSHKNSSNAHSKSGPSYPRITLISALIKLLPMLLSRSTSPNDIV